MKRLIIIGLAVTMLAGCTMAWRVNPVTGEMPIWTGIKAGAEAVPAALTSGNWLQVAISTVSGLVFGCLTTKKRKDRQISEIASGVEKFKEISNEAVVNDLLSKLSGAMNSDTKGIVKKIRAKSASHEVRAEG